MKANTGALARYVLLAAADQLGAERPEVGYALQAALAERDDGRLGVEIAGIWDAEAGRIGRAFDRRASAAFTRPDSVWQAVFSAGMTLGSEEIEAEHQPALAGFALSALAREPALKTASTALKRAAVAARSSQSGPVLHALDHPAVRAAPSALVPVLTELARLSGAPRAELIERLPTLHRTTPPANFNLDRGRRDRADLVLAVLRAHDVKLRDPERGRIRVLTRDDLAEAILRDPFWDDIDASTQEEGVVEGILRFGRPSPAIDGVAFGQKHVYIQRIVR